MGAGVGAGVGGGDGRLRVLPWSSRYAQLAPSWKPHRRPLASVVLLPEVGLPRQRGAAVKDTALARASAAARAAACAAASPVAFPAAPAPALAAPAAPAPAAAPPPASAAPAAVALDVVTAVPSENLNTQLLPFWKPHRRPLESGVALGVMGGRQVGAASHDTTPAWAAAEALAETLLFCPEGVPMHALYCTLSRAYTSHCVMTVWPAAATLAPWATATVGVPVDTAPAVVVVMAVPPVDTASERADATAWASRRRAASWP